MNEALIVAKIVVGVALLGSIPAIVFGAYSKAAPRSIFRFLVVAIAIANAGPTLTFVCFWLLGWFPRGPLWDDGYENGYRGILEYDLWMIWILAAAALPLGITLAIRYRLALRPYLGLSGFQVAWALLNTMFLVALTD